MIKGGVSGVCRIGNYKPGTSQTFLPILADVGLNQVDEILSGNSAVRYSASARIRNIANTAWVALDDVTYFSISQGSDGSGSANITLAKPNTWSIDSPAYTNLLRPSERILQIEIQMAAKGKSLAVNIFTGQITNYSEAHGQRNGSITLVAKASSLALENRRPDDSISSLTAYRKIKDQLKNSALFAAGQVPVCLFEDYTLTGFEQYVSLLTLLERLPPVKVDVLNRQTGGILQLTSGDDNQPEQLFSLTDDNQISLTRSVGNARAYNTVRVLGMIDGVVSIETIQDDADVARRGNVRYGPVYGVATRPMALNIIDAQAWIGEMLNGSLSAQIQLNPFLHAGDIVNFSSSRLFVSSGRARIGSINHNFSRGTAFTSLSRMAIMP